MKKRTHRFLGKLAALAMTIVLCGCAGGSEKNGAEEKSFHVGSEVSGEAVYGGTIVVGVQQDFDSLDPHLAGTAGTTEVLFNIFEGLVKPDSNGNLISAVASDYTISDDGSRYVFTLRDGIKFHNGEPVTIDDVIYSIKRCAGMLEGQTQPLISAYSVIAEVNPIDNTGVELILKEPDTELIGYLTAAIVPEDYEDQATAPIGTGPFCFASYSPQRSLVVEKFEDYWNPEMPYLDQVEFRIVANTDSAMLELKAGSIDIYPYLTSDQAKELQASASEKKDSGFQILVGNANLVQALFLNNQEEPFHDIRVRQALNYAVDEKAIMEMVADGYGTEIGSGMFPSFTKYYEESLANAYSTDLEKAKQLLADAGYPDGFSMSIVVPSNYQFHIDTAQVIVEQLHAIHVNATIELVEWANWYTDVYKGRNYQATIIGLDAELAPKALLQRYGSNRSNNFINFSNEEYDNVLKEALTSTEDEVKIRSYKRLQEILSEQAASVYLQDPALLVAVNTELSGYTFYPVYVQDMSRVYYKAE